MPVSGQLRKRLAQVLDARQQQGWLALFAHPALPLSTYGSRRLGKLMPSGELQFSIGATGRGREINLNHTIEQIIRSEGLTPLVRETTSGSRKVEAIYPAFQTDGVPVEQVLRIVHRVEGAAIQGQG